MVSRGGAPCAALIRLRPITRATLALTARTAVHVAGKENSTKRTSVRVVALPLMLRPVTFPETYPFTLDEMQAAGWLP